MARLLLQQSAVSTTPLLLLLLFLSQATSFDDGVKVQGSEECNAMAEQVGTSHSIICMSTTTTRTFNSCVVSVPVLVGVLPVTRLSPVVNAPVLFDFASHQVSGKKERADTL
ncbi:hypothetical protein F2P81_012147 [Scophthalmus maximus]|uniref:Uncharacterized protein n=1 Tax=Scophthalmus maximus TaxID=52904 RepID=A0A6A4SNW6_SCOMX|nr:hypothetical protein F2P81_012147 [Scophthalmus maximus]